VSFHLFEGFVVFAFEAFYWSGFNFYFPLWRMVIRDSGQRQKHGASQLGKITRWLLRFSSDHHLTAPDTSIPADPAPPPPEPSSAAIAATVATPAAVLVVAAVSAIVPLAVVTTVVLVLLPPPSLPLPLLVDCCLLFVSNAVAVAATAAIVAINAPTAVVVVAAPAAVTVAVVVATITVAATGNAVGGGGSA